MKRTRKRFSNFNRIQWRDAAQEIGKNRSWLVLCAILLLGMTVGALLCRGNSPLSGGGVALLVDEFRLRRSDQSFWLTFASSFEALFVIFLILFVSGVSAAGIAAVPLVVFFRGAGLGLVMGYFYASYAFRGVLYVLVMILPNAFLSTVVFLVLARESMVLMAVCGALTWNGWSSLLPTAAMVVGTPFLWTQNGKTLRLAQLFFVSPCWLTYNVIVFSIAGVFTESFNIISVIVSLCRFGLKGLDTAVQEPASDNSSVPKETKN